MNIFLTYFVLKFFREISITSTKGPITYDQQHVGQ